MSAHLPLIMGVVNVTPDSFSDGGAFHDPAHAIDHALKLVEEGAAILDIGGESTRPGAEMVPAETELARVLPVIKGLASQTAAVISIDTRKPEAARAAIDAGASIWNDVSALSYSSESLRAAAALDCRIVLMHAQGEPETMQVDPHYDDVVEEVLRALKDRIAACERAGIDRARLIVDPGVGFGKRLDHNLALIADLGRFAELGLPVLLGASRKRFIAAIDREGPAAGRLGGSIAAALAGAARGAAILRVHDVAATRQALSVHFAIDSASSGR
ncbi:MAG TPA: dihydropteroate synthase [Parvularculaceae bacterium]|nr:dihydropteroate synthase [Parvularculaceae bacterium]